MTRARAVRLNDGRVVANFVVQALCGQPLSVQGSGRQTRSFCYVEDQVRGLLCGWSVLGRDQLLDDLRERPEAALERESRWSRDPAMADLGKQLLGLATVPG